MNLLIGLIMLTASATSALAFDFGPPPAPGPELALGFTGAIAVGGAYIRRAVFPQALDGFN